MKLRKYGCPTNMSQSRIDAIRAARVTWFQGYKLPRTDMVKELIYAHVVATQEYDHVTEKLIREFLISYATRHGIQ